MLAAGDERGAHYALRLSDGEGENSVCPLAEWTQQGLLRAMDATGDLAAALFREAAVRDDTRHQCEAVERIMKSDG